MKGRKRKAGKREPNGRIQRAAPRDIGTPETARRVEAMKGKGTSALALDRLAAAGKITQEQHQAGSLYRSFREEAYGRTAPKIASYGEMISEGTLPAWQLPDERGPDRQSKAESNYRRGWKHVRERGLFNSCAELTSVVIDNNVPTEGGMRGLLVALDLLHELYFAGAQRDEVPRVRWAS